MTRSRITEMGLVVSVISTHPQSCCPLCSQPSSHIHSHYQRTLKDAPCVGRQLQLFLTVRKFFCRNPLCSQKVFTERLKRLVEPWARMTTRLREHIASIGRASCGKSGVRLGHRLGIETSRNTTLRRIMEVPDDARGSVVYLGIDDFSFQRGSRFGTILVDLESHRPIDVLPDRQAETSAAWMRENPEIAVVSRDRGGAYASAATQGAPQALQCADRFHLVKNLGEALEGFLAHHLAAYGKRQTQTTRDSQAPVWQSKRATRSSPTLLRLQENRREERLAHYEQVVARL